MDGWEFRLQVFFRAFVHQPLLISTRLNGVLRFSRDPQNGNTCLKDCSRSCQGPSRVWEAFLAGLWDERWTIGLEQARNAASYKFLFSCSILQVWRYSPDAVFILAPRTCEKKFCRQERDRFAILKSLIESNMGHLQKKASWQKDSCQGAEHMAPIRVPKL